MFPPPCVLWKQFTQREGKYLDFLRYVAEMDTRTADSPVRRSGTHNRYFETSDEMKKTIGSVFKGMQRVPSKITGYLKPFCWVEGLVTQPNPRSHPACAIYALGGRHRYSSRDCHQAALHTAFIQFVS